MESAANEAPPPRQTVEAGDPSAITRYEQSLAELEQIVARLEAGEQSLEQALRDYERGVQLERDCQRALDEAERRVAALDEPREDADVDPTDIPF
jgi:exodeoxyribonuclease VII small subunit